MQENDKWKWSHSVVSDSSWPHGLQPTRFLGPWDFPGKSTGVGCPCLLQAGFLAYNFWHLWIQKKKKKIFAGTLNFWPPERSSFGKTQDQHQDMVKSLSQCHSVWSLGTESFDLPQTILTCSCGLKKHPHRSYVIFIKIQCMCVCNKWYLRLPRFSFHSHLCHIF